MKQEDKELLLKDLCGRLPYGVKISIPDLWTSEREIEILDEVFRGDDGLYRVNSKGQLIEHIKPYLFPLSSMTEEEKNKLSDELIELQLKSLSGEIHSSVSSVYEIDYYVSHHIDYQGLIPKGLANDATGLGVY